MPRRTNTAKKRSPEAPLYQLTMTLKWSKPPIWRRVVVRGDMTLGGLHDVIQIAMGWMDEHLHHFIFGSGFDRTFYGTPDPQFLGMGSQTLDEESYTVADLAPAKTKFIYEYDSGDSWLHEMVVEKILPPDAAFKHPVCLAGANACPPEDCGGISGYYDLLEILADPKHPDHEARKEWMSDEIDTTEFDRDEVNRILTRVFK